MDGKTLRTHADKRYISVIIIIVTLTIILIEFKSHSERTKGEPFYYDGIPDEELHYHLNTAFEAVVNSNNVVLLFHPKIFFMMKEEIISF